jgi:hypothetical protein
MSFESLMTRLQGFNTSVEALATIGAELRLRCDDLSGDSHSRSLIQDVIQKIEPGILEGLEENQERAALALTKPFFRWPGFRDHSSPRKLPPRLWNAFAGRLSREGGLWFGFYTPAPSELGEALNRLRAVRSGGHQWTAIEAMDQIRSLGFGLVETVSPSPALLFVLGQRAKAAN